MSTTAQNLTTATSAVVHIAFTTTDGRLYGSLCNPYLYTTGKRMNLTDAPATCKRCAAAVNRQAEQDRKIGATR